MVIFNAMEMLSHSYKKLTSLITSDCPNFAVCKAAAFAILLAGSLKFLLGYTAAPPDFTQFDAGEERKQAFLDYFLPIIQQQNRELLTQRAELLDMHQEKGQLSFLERYKVSNLAETYEVEEFDFDEESDWQTLIRRVDIVPPSLALAQAANESAWGTSRFAEQGNNYYGQWCFVEGCGIVPNQRPAGESYEVADFSSAEESVEYYLRNINHHPAYSQLRQTREQLRNSDATVSGLQLVNGLTNYSERGEEYVSELRNMIQFNDLAQLDGSDNPGYAVN
ncbi:MAG: glucosaminidase domain-containing protein [Gammaproteobacteria bacterium]